MRPYLLTLSMILGACAPDASLDSGTAEGTDSEASTSDGDSSGSTGDEAVVAPATYAGGSRLQPVVNRGPSGEQTLQHWYDTELAIDCAVLYDTAGDLRCLPLTIAFAVFSNEFCTRPAVENQGGYQEGDLVIVKETYCGGGVLHRALRVQEPLQEVYRDSSDGSCARQAWGPPNASRAESLDLDMFALATPRVESEGSDLARIILEFDDGAWNWAGPYDTERDAECDPWMLDGRSVCVPEFRAGVTSNVYADETCGGSPVGSYTVSDDCPGQATVALAVASYETLSDLNEGVWHVGSTVEEPFIDLENQGCSPLVPDPDSTLEFGYWNLTAAIPDDFPSAEPVAIGEGRFLREYLLDSAGAVVATNGALLGAQSWRDEELGFSCRIAGLSTGDAGCVPHPQVLTTAYADEDCTVPLTRDDPQFVGGGPIRDGDWVSFVAPAVGGFDVVAYGTIGELHDGPVFDKPFGGDCEPGTFSERRAVSNLHLAAEIETFDVVAVP